MAGASGAAQAARDASIRTHFAAAQEAQRAQDYVAAERQYKAVLAIEPKFAEVHMNLGLVYQLQNRTSEAMSEFEQALKTKPQLAGANFFLGVDLTTLGQGVKAVPYLQRAVEQEPDRTDIRTWLATALELKGDLNRELATLHQALERDPRNVDLLYLLGHAYEALGKRESAALEKRAPDSGRAEQLLAESYAGSSEWPTAVLHFENALAASPQSAGLHVELGEVLLRAGRLARARQEFEQELKLFPQSVRALVRRGEARLAEGDVAGMIADWTEALAADAAQVRRVLGLGSTTFGGATPDPLQEALKEQMEGQAPQLRAEDSPAARLALTFLAAQQGRTGESAPELSMREESTAAGDLCSQARMQQALRGGRLSSAAPCLLGVVQQELQPSFRIRVAGALLDAGEYQASLDALGPLSQVDRESLDVSYLRARCYEGLASAAYLRLYQSDRNSYRVHQLAADLASANGNDVAAFAEYRAAVLLKPTLPNLHYSLGHLLWKNSKVVEARKELEAELVLNHHHAGALNDLGQTYLLEQQPEEALLYLDRARSEGLNTPELHRDLGTAYSALGDLKRAGVELNLALAGDRDGSIHFKLANLYKAQGEKQRAAQEFAAASALNREFHRKAEEQTGRRRDIER